MPLKRAWIIAGITMDELATNDEESIAGSSVAKKVAELPPACHPEFELRARSCLHPSITPARSKCADFQHTYG